MHKHYFKFQNDLGVITIVVLLFKQGRQRSDTDQSKTTGHSTAQHSIGGIDRHGYCTILNLSHGQVSTHTHKHTYGASEYLSTCKGNINDRQTNGHDMLEVISYIDTGFVVSKDQLSYE